MPPNIKKICLLFLLLAEFIPRLFLFFTSSPFPSQFERIPGTLTSFNKQETSQTDPLLGHLNRKLYTGHFLNPYDFRFYSLSTNKEGFRTLDFDQLVASKKTLLLIGDSYIFGEAVDQDHRVESYMRREIKDSNIQIVSLAAPSYSILQYYLLLKKWNSRLKPSTVIINIDQSDFEEDQVLQHKYDFQGGLPFQRKDRKLLASKSHHKAWMTHSGDYHFEDISSIYQTIISKSAFFYSLDRGLKQAHAWWMRMRLHHQSAKIEVQKSKLALLSTEELLRRPRKNLPDDLKENLITESLEAAKEKYTLSFSLLRAIKNLCSPPSCRLYFATYPYPWEVSPYESPYFQSQYFGFLADLKDHQTFRQLVRFYAKELEVTYLDSYDALAQAQVKRYNTFDPHFNSKGNEIFAKFLSQQIQK